MSDDNTPHMMAMQQLSGGPPDTGGRQMNKRWTPIPDISDANIDDEFRVDQMVKWFFENFEDAAERTPYETAEGGYQYIWGGPYDARETLEEVFTNVADDLIHRAAAKIEYDGDDWVPVPHEDDYK